jgi:hypothetical protein
MRDTSLREQLVRAAVLTTLVVILLNAVALLIYEWVAYRKAWIANIQTTANLMADAAVPALELDDPASAHKTLGMLHSKPQNATSAVHCSLPRSAAPRSRLRTPSSATASCSARST